MGLWGEHFDRDTNPKRPSSMHVATVLPTLYVKISYVASDAQLLSSSTGQCSQHRKHLHCHWAHHLFLSLTCGS